MDSTGDHRSSNQRKFDNFFSKKNIEEQCSEESLEMLHEAFLIAENERMDENQFRKAFESILKIYMNPQELHTLFLKINSNRNGFVTWDEFVSYVLLEFQDKDLSWQSQILEPPLTGFPIVLRTHHRSPITRILFCPEVLPDRTSSFFRGCYMTASRDGMINYWSLDLVYERTVQSSNPYRKVRPTIITDLIAMPDIQIVCTSSTERDLRFYDVVAKKFDLRVVISSLACAVVCMSYHFSVDINEDSYIILGDMSGSVIVMSFNTAEKGPFKHSPQQDMVHHRYEAVVKGDLKGLKVTEFKNVHSNWLCQVAYFVTLRAFISCSKCSNCSLLVSDPTGTKMQYKFSVEKGISCFNFCEESQLLVTGGPDCIIRTWHPFVTEKPSMVLHGHHAAICAIVVQNSGTRLYTLAKDRCIKVWEVGAQTCIQTYNNLPSELGEHTELSIIYNDITHKMIIASMIIAVIVCERVIDHDSSDGFTHTQSVSCVLYNTLFKVIVSIGLDSCIIVWDPWLGRRLYLVTNAHSQLLFGQQHPVEITSACFDDAEQLLLTGARDGTLKMWNFNTGTCIRRMAIEENCEITSVIWLKDRILCSGWNRRVTEFADAEEGVHKKSWEDRHTEYILCSSVRYPQALATASYNGELVFWRLETGQPYRRYQVSDPTRRYTIVYKKEAKHEVSSPRSSKRKIAKKHPSGKMTRPSLSTVTRNEDITIEKSAHGITRIVSVRSIIFLKSRQLTPNTGTLLVSLESGVIQVWTHHTAAGFLMAFTVIHKDGDYALSLATDPNDEFLITGHDVGYIKVWLIKNYALPNPPKVSVPALRLEFPFLWKTRIDGRAKRAVRDQKLPLLLSSLKGHTRAINSIQYIPAARVIISGSNDHTVRLWTLSGRYISTLGTFAPWSTILPDVPADSYLTNYRIPPDLKRISSSTTMKVLRGGMTEEKISGTTEEADFNVELSADERNLLYGEQFDVTILEQHADFLSRNNIYEDTPILDNSLAYIPVYAHLTAHDLKTVEIPEKPAILKKQATVRGFVKVVTKLKKKAKKMKRGLDKSSMSIGISSSRDERTI